ncbi:hypothetical protein ACVINU_005009 [Bradyrhizobium diazoefficiens]
MVRLIAIVGLALGETEQPRSSHKLQIEIGIPVREGRQPRRQEGGTEAIGRTDPHRSGQPRHGAADLLLVGDDGRFHRFGAVGDALAGLGEEIAGLAPVKQLGREVLFQPVDATDHGRMVDAELFCRSRNRAAPHDGQHEAKVVPVDSALIQHFRTSMVQYIRLESYKMQVDRNCQSEQAGLKEIFPCVQSDISSAARRSRVPRAAPPTFSSR